MFLIVNGKGLAFIALALLFCGLPLTAATQIIDCGSASDFNFLSGAPFTIATPGSLPDATLRYGGSFSYSIPVDNIPYVLTFRFVEPCGPGAGCSAVVNGPRQRVFSVTANSQVVLPDLDLYAVALTPPGTTGALVPVSRSVVAMGSDKLLRIGFLASVRTAVVSAIEITPLFEVLGGGAVSMTARELQWAEFVAVRQVDGSYLFGRPLLLPGSVVSGITVFLAGSRQQEQLNYRMDPANPLRLIPMNSAWPVTSEVLVEYLVLVNGGPTISSPAKLAALGNWVVGLSADTPHLGGPLTPSR